MEALEIIGYEDSRKSYFLESFDSCGEKSVMYASFKKKALLIKGVNMRSKLSSDKSGKRMAANWEKMTDNENWMPWMEMKFIK